MDRLQPTLLETAALLAASFNPQTQNYHANASSDLQAYLVLAGAAALFALPTLTRWYLNKRFRHQNPVDEDAPTWGARYEGQDHP